MQETNEKIKKLFNSDSLEGIEELINNKPIQDTMLKQWEECGSYKSEKRNKKRLWKAIENRLGKPTTSSSSLIMRIAAVLALVSSVGFITYQFGKKQSSDLAPELMVEVISQGHSKYMLPDSTIVWMQPGTQLTYSKHFNENRKVRLEGESVFEVTKKQDSNFIVDLGNSVVEVMGTVFSVQNRHQIDRQLVTLYEGKVQFTSSELALSYDMIAGEVLDYTVQDGLRVHKFENAGWRNGEVSFQEIPLRLLIDQLCMKFQCKIELSADLPPDKLLTGAIQYNETVEQILYKISYAMKCNYKKINETKFLLY